ncbi:MAG TPA: right-handed parallel beta-helix repeat-containing protein [Pyrinomonadaceae bacterium]|nr:right-handed parallel beta-helix repeat-containing protein [Pyrinomonadaceae bacterium]
MLAISTQVRECAGVVLSKLQRHRAKVRLAVSILLASVALFTISATVARVQTQSGNPPAGNKNEAARKITIHAANHTSSLVHLKDGYELSQRVGNDSNAAGAQPDLANPLSIASADFDEDGTPDLVTGHSGGALAFYRGNVDALFPNSREAKARKAVGQFSDEPFNSEARVVEVPESPDLIETGDFNADGHKDVLISARGGNHFLLLAGNGHGTFAPTQSVALPGKSAALQITALAVGEVGKPDGQTDVVVAITDGDGAKVVVFEHPQGAFNGVPETFRLSAAASDLAIGDLDGDHYADIALATGNVLTIIHERGQVHPWDIMKDVQLKRPPAIVDTRGFSFNIASLAIGEFTSQPGNSLALLSDEGKLHLLTPASPVQPGRVVTDALVAGSTATNFTPTGVDAKEFRVPADIFELAAAYPAPDPNAVEIAVSDQEREEQHERAQLAFLKTISAQVSDLSQWILESDVTNGPLVVGSANGKLVVARTSVSGLDDLVIADSVSNRVSIVSQCARVESEMRTRLCQNGAAVTAPAVEGHPLAVLPMRLNEDALNDLVVIRGGAAAPSIVMTAPTALFTVDTDNDFSGFCTPGQPCSLRAAINSARTQPGSIINFNIPGAGAHTIAVGSELPRVENAVTIDGTSQPGFSGTPLIEISGENFQTGHAIDGLKIQASNCVIRGLAINRFTAVQIQPGVLVGGNGLTLESTSFHPNNGHNIVEGNFLGTDPTGRLDEGNDATGLNVFDDHNNTIGGTTAAAKNVMSGNGSPTMRGAGLSLTGANNNLIKGNWIGINNDGTDRLGNSRGIYLTGFNNLLGGDEAGAGNTISGNGEPRPNSANCDGEGINAFALFNADTKALVSAGAVIKGNRIGTDPSGNDPIGNCSQGIATEPLVATTIGSVTPNGRNVISGNNWDAVWCMDFSIFTGRPTEGGFCFVGGNNIGTNILGTGAIGNSANNYNPTFRFRTGKVTIWNNLSFTAVGGQAGTTTGGPCTGFCNLVSGNLLTGPDDASALVVAGYGNVAILDNFVGTTVTGDVGLPNDSGVGVFGIKTSFPTIWLGAIGLDQFNSEVSLGNLISGNFLSGATVGGLMNAQVQGNLIGTDISGTSAIPNGLLSSDNPGLLISVFTGIVAIGSQDPVGRNIISGNRGSGISIFGSTAGPVTILNNYLGVNSSTSPLGNGRAGIQVQTLSKVNISSNLIQSNHDEGVLVVGDSSGLYNSSGTNVERNQIKNNGLLGIDLSISDLGSGNGVTANDCGDTDIGPNELQNFPVLQAPVFNGDGTVTVVGTLRSEPFQRYRVDFYSNVNADASGYGEGETFIGQISVTVDGNGFANLLMTSTGMVPANSPITATATNVNTGSTSEFSCVAGQCAGTNQPFGLGTCPAPMIVNVTTDDHDADVTDGVCDTDFNTPQFQCSLRAAIEQANDSHALTRSISFNIPGSGVQTIVPASALPNISMPVQIYGYTQGGAPGSHLVEINGVNAGDVNGLTLDAGSDGSVIDELTINRFHNSFDILIKSGKNITIKGCYLGLNPDGMTFDSDPSHVPAGGVAIGTMLNTIGGPEVADGNVITGNLAGVAISKGNNTVSNNKIGTDKDGNQVVSNGNPVTGNSFGVLVSNSTGNTIGGDLGSAGNVISGNVLDGVALVNSSNNFIKGNFIGTNATGLAAVPNGRAGVAISESSAGNTIGGVSATDRNIISGNNPTPESCGVLIDFNAGTENQILNNYIGVSANAQNALPNSFGVTILASGSIIGSVAAPNIISGNTTAGVQLDAPSGTLSNTNIIGNLIGLNSSGQILHNLIGVALTGDVQNTLIKDNIVSGNDQAGVGMNKGPGNSTGPSNNTVFRNKIGTNAAGTAAVPNQVGIALVQCSTNTISGNLVSGNSNFGFLLGGANDQSVFTSGNIIQNNLIGTTPDGAGALSNVAGGIAIFDNAQNNLIGGDASLGNVISGNGDLSGQNLAVGIFIGSVLANAPPSSYPTGNMLQGNRIGLQKSADVPLPNNEGVALTFASANQIGGTDANLANVISGNLADGIALRHANSNQVQGNFIGTGSGGSGGAGNGGNGVLISEGSSQNMIGGLAAGAGNTIKFNTGSGVLLDPTAGTGNSIDPNAIFANQVLGIDVGGAGVPWPNDPGDSDAGPNLHQNYPEFTSAIINGSGDLILQYKVDSAPTNANYGTDGIYIEFFKGDAGLQGESFLGSTNYTAANYGNGSPGQASFNAGNAVGLNIHVGDQLVATATDADGNTSEFTSVNVGVVASPTATDGAIRGVITDNSGQPIAGVALHLSGSQDRLMITDAHGRYQFDGVETSGFYLLEPSRANFDFNPAQRSFSQVGHQTNAAFTGTQTGATQNPLDATAYFVRQQYLDFLGREPDEAGLKFWYDNIERCGADETCRSVQRVNTSAAFFLSIEFQQTGYLAYRVNKAAFGSLPNAPVPVEFNAFMSDKAELGREVIVNQVGWQMVLERNTQAYLNAFVQRQQFSSAFPATMTPEEFVDRLCANAGIAVAGNERATILAEFGSAANSSDLAARARALRLVAENSALKPQQLTRAFVLMQYFGYLRRDPNSGPDVDYSGFNFWLNKLDNFNGDYQRAEMVKAFLVAGEYRRRFR